MLKCVQDSIAQLESDGDSGTHMGMSRILRLFIFHRVTDLYGDCPYSDAGKGYISGILTPKYDAQQDIYMDMLKELEKAVTQIRGGGGLSSADVIIEGKAAR